MYIYIVYIYSVYIYIHIYIYICASLAGSLWRRQALHWSCLRRQRQGPLLTIAGGLLDLGVCSLNCIQDMKGNLVTTSAFTRRVHKCLYISLSLNVCVYFRDGSLHFSCVLVCLKVEMVKKSPAFLYM